MPLASYLDLPDAPKQAKPWTQGGMFAFVPAAARVIAKTLSAPDAVSALCIVVFGIIALSGQHIPAPFFGLAYGFFLLSVFERVQKLMTDIPIDPKAHHVETKQ